MPNTPIPTSTSASPPSEASNLSNNPSQPLNGTKNGTYKPQSVARVAPLSGRRIPIPMYPDSNTPPQRMNGETGRLMGAAMASMPSAMRDDVPSPTPQSLEGASPANAFTRQDVTVEQFVRAQRPRSLRMQLRFLRTVLFALWLFGRLIFWQVYVAKGFPDWVSKRNNRRWQKYARQFRNFAVDMGGVMIKAGQFASTRADVLPEEVIAQLADLQDKVPTIPYTQIERVLKRELGDLEARYAWIDHEPIAAASMGQVHRARLKIEDNEKPVVIKVQRPNIRNLVYTDMAALFIVAHVAMRFDFVSRRADVIQLSEEFGRVLLEEVSYEKEAQNAIRFQAMFADDAGVYVPRVYLEHSTDQILTMEDVTSLKIDDYEALKSAGIARKDVARRLMDTYMKQIFEDRFFHADPHPGNLFVRPMPVHDVQPYLQRGEGRPFTLIFIDFGMTGMLTREIVQGLINTLTAVVTRDGHKLVQSYLELGFLLPSADLKRIEEASNAVFDTVWGMSMTDMASMDFEVVATIGSEFNDLLYDMPFRVPQDFVYLGRTVGILSGMATTLDPTYNPWNEIGGYMQELITTDVENNIFDEFRRTLQKSIDEIVEGGPEGFFKVAQRFINQFQRISRTEKMLQSIVDGDVQIETKLSNQHRRQLERIEVQGKRTSRIFMTGSLLIVATLMHTNGDSNLAIISLIGAGGTYISTWLLR